MSEDKRSLKVFLCHAHADRDAVRALYARLTKDGVDAWLDKEKLLPGQDWELEIRKAVREADVVVVCLSKQFNQAGFRQKEVRLALDTAMEQPEGEIFIIPARLEECDTLESLRKWHWVDLFEDDGYEQLIRALRTRADRISATLQVKKSGSSSQIKYEKDKTELVEPKEKIVETQKRESRKGNKTLRLNTGIIIALIGACATVLVGLLSSPLLINAFENKVTSTLPSASATFPMPTVEPTNTVVVSTSTPQPKTENIWSEPVLARMPTLNEIREDMLSIWDANRLSLGDMTSPSVRSFTGTANANKEYLWPIYWCAIDRPTLDMDVENISTVFMVNGEKVPDEYIFDYYYDNNTGWKCNYRASVIGKFPRNTSITLQVTRDFKTDIFDGQGTYPAGSYTYKLVLSVK